VLDGHVDLDLACIDRLYLNAYVPNLQVGGQVVTFLTAHLGFPIPSPALLQKIGNRFRRDVKAFAAEHQIPILHLRMIRPGNCGHSFAWKWRSHGNIQREEPSPAPVPA